MNHLTQPHPTDSLHFELGSFEGFNFRTQSAIEHLLTAAEVVNWDHDRQGEAEFWPSGDHPAVALLLQHRNVITASELLALDRLLQELGGDSTDCFLQIHYAVNVCGAELGSLSRDEVEDNFLQVFYGSSFLDVRRAAAYELFELYYPDEYAVWEKSTCDGLIFDHDRFLDSPSFFVEEVRLADQVALLVAAR
jgi:hypothetical protein